MQDRKKSQLALESPLRVLRKMLQDPVDHGEQLRQQCFSVGIDQGVEDVRKSKNYMEVLHGQHLVEARLKRPAAGPA